MILSEPAAVCTSGETRAVPSRRVRAGTLGLMLAVLVAFFLCFRFSGDGDAVGHYLNLRQSLREPAAALYAWTRPAYVLLMVGPAAGGILCVRLAAAVVTVLTAWLTMRAADRLGLPHPTLAGVLVILQPMVFPLASDTMTEMPLALGLIIAVHLWWDRRWAASALLIGFLPLVRPEGFLVAAMWGVMLLLNRNGGSLPRRCATAVLLGAGMAAWVLACWVLAHDPLLFYRFWSWPAKSYASYGHGGPLDYFLRFPDYCGPVLLVLFLAGLASSFQRRMALPWAIWALIILVHDILWWRGWFASAGLMRIIACTSPFTALICLYGWNRLAQWRAVANLPQRRRLALGAGVLALAAGWTLTVFFVQPANVRCVAVGRMADYIREHNVIGQAPRFFAADRVFVADLGLAHDDPKFVNTIWGRENELELLAGLPAATMGVWDNQRGQEWYQLTPEDVLKVGYEQVHVVEQMTIRFRRWGWRFTPCRDVQRYVLLRKK